ncbi:hypothetical protein KS4_08620 [Poriferisphaera corsica]|uniref:Uncharacterized protein n=1 Tax=Poriferisphaera corsica TaxID=2528020 RepID=A0A517YRG7_9BACT|nr:hypothetical protein KS4_08620 [Poriferisphaera corsica]
MTSHTNNHSSRKTRPCCICFKTQSMQHDENGIRLRAQKLTETHKSLFFETPTFCFWLKTIQNAPKFGYFELNIAILGSGKTPKSRFCAHKNLKFYPAHHVDGSEKDEYSTSFITAANLIFDTDIHHKLLQIHPRNVFSDTAQNFPRV